MYSTGGGAGSRLEIRAMCGSPTQPDTCFLNGSMGGVESTIEADHERYAVFTNHTQSLVHLTDVQADLLAEDRLPAAASGDRSTWVSVLLQMATASTESVLTAATSAPSVSFAMMSACIRPVRPTPSTPIRTVTRL